MFDRQSNKLDDTLCCPSFTSFKELTYGLSNFDITQIVNKPRITPILPNKGEKYTIAAKEKKNLQNPYK
jgi:hypothetical protein